ncbi:histidinol dehydrogenase [bacterium E08(2017)]|nr:histidinol dehydrogenase [bacterium E08(2017)]
MKPRIVKWNIDSKSRTVNDFVKRPAFDDKAETAAAAVLSDIRKDGNKAIAKYCKKFDKATLKPSDFKVKRSELVAAKKKISKECLSAVREAHKRVKAFAKAGIRKDWSMSTGRGGNIGEKFVPLDRIGVYVPGGAAPLASTALMTVTLAKTAGVPEIVACTPCGPDKQVDPVLLHALEVSGATEVYRVGGIQSIGLMAYGTSTIKKVQKIVGPGGAYVTAAKRQVYGNVALDLVAGPSEIAILADSSANSKYVAADLLSQAEHGTGHEKALLVTSSSKLAQSVQKEVIKQAAELPANPGLDEVIQRGMLIVVVKNLDIGMELCNMFAPEHFEILVNKPKTWLKKVRCAGAVFLGNWSPEAVGDYVAGPSHVLPTGGAAEMFSGLTVDDFRRRTSFISFTKADLKDTLPAIETFGAVEGLHAHAKSARIRFE